ncbi:MAG: ChaN family lipoprotein [Desulfobacteraceae bacterium]|jgi:uncharacterized iron-regulated protein
MRRLFFLILILASAAPLACKTATASHEVRLYDLEQQAILSQTRALLKLKRASIVLVGEHHNNVDHHLAQLKVIQLLHNTGRKVAIGLEMFRQDSQQALDQWIAGRMSEDQFKPIYLDNWNFGWELYGPIFTYAMEHDIPMVGLNVSRKITAQVAYHGFESLSEAQKGTLEGITCNVTAEYRDFIRNGYRAHGHGNMNFNRFCEAQLVWDTAMAVNAIDYLKHHPDTVLVILAGSGHARKLGIPSQLDKRTAKPYVVVLPETRGIFDADTTTTKDADFILLKE